MARPHYRNVPFYGGDIGQLRAKLEQPHSSFQRWLVLGDSQESINTGNGEFFFPAANRLLYEKYGQPTETPFRNFTWTSTPFFLSNAAGADSTGGTADSYDLPGVFRRITNGTNTGPLHSYTTLGTADSNTGRGVKEYLDFATGNIVWDVFVRKNTAGPDQLRMRLTSGVSLRSYNGTPVDQIFAAAALSANNTDWVQLTSQNLAYDTANPIWNHWIQGWDGSAAQTGLHVGGARLRDTNRNNGVSLGTFSVGGNTAANFLSNYGNGGSLLSLVGPWSIIFISFGTNDSLTQDPDQYKADLQALISTIRGSAWLNEPNQFFVLMSDVPRYDLTGTQKENYDAQAAVSFEVAAENSNVAFMNLTRQMALEAKSDDLYDDEVHLNERGQLAQAKAFLSLLSTA